MVRDYQALAYGLEGEKMASLIWSYRKHAILLGLLTLLTVVIAACSSAPDAPAPDMEATVDARVAEEVAKALQAAVTPTPTPTPTSVPPTPTPTPTPVPPAPTPTPTPVPPSTYSYADTSAFGADA
jgi:outer membrane biosynthesis protein TonB